MFSSKGNSPSHPRLSERIKARIASNFEFLDQDLAADIGTNDEEAPAPIPSPRLTVVSAATSNVCQHGIDAHTGEGNNVVCLSCRRARSMAPKPAAKPAPRPILVPKQL